MKLDESTDEEWELTFHHPLQQEDRGQMTALNALKGERETLKKGEDPEMDGMR